LQYNEFPNDQDRCRYWGLMTTSECCALQDRVSRSLEVLRDIYILCDKTDYAKVSCSILMAHRRELSMSA